MAGLRARGHNHTPTLGEHRAVNPGGQPHPLRVAFVGGLHVGVETVFRNVSAAVGRDGRILPLAIAIDSWRPDRIERFLRFLPPSTRGTFRYVAGTLPLFELGQLDAIWSLLDLPLLPWMVARNLQRRVRVLYAADSTPRQLQAFGVHYGYWGGRSVAKFALREIVYRRFLQMVDAVHTYSEWAATSFRDDYAVPASKVHVLPPGVDTTFWSPLPGRTPHRRSRILFVGGDFQRKGGDLLLHVYRTRLKERAELDLVTRPGLVEPEPGVRVHTDMRPNDERLRDLYRECDLLAIPTRADCFSMVGLEALASGLPVITCPVGGVAEIFSDGIEGMYVPPDDGSALAQTLEQLLADGHRRRTMGEAARRLACLRYDAASNTARLRGLIADVVGPQGGTVPAPCAGRADTSAYRRWH